MLKGIWDRITNKESTETINNESFSLSKEPEAPPPPRKNRRRNQKLSRKKRRAPKRKIDESLEDEDDDDDEDEDWSEEPTSYERYGEDAKLILGSQGTFDGFKIEVNKTLEESPPFTVSHSLSLGSATEEPSYSFSVNAFDGNNMYAGRVDSNLSVMGRTYLMLGSQSHILFSGQAAVEPHNSAFHCEYSVGSPRYSLSAKWGNPGMYSLSYSQRIRKRWHVGMETVYMYKQAISILSAGLEYNGSNGTWTANINPAQFSLSYSRSFAPNNLLSESFGGLAAELVLHQTGGIPEATIQCGLSYLLERSQVRTYYDLYNWKVGVVLEEDISDSTTLTLCGELDHFKKTYRFGIGLSID